MRYVFCTALIACGGPSVSGLDSSFSLEPDGGVVALPAPEVEAPSVRIPYSVVTVRGRASGRRVFIEGGRNPVKVDILPLDGTFCADVPLYPSAEHRLLVYAQDASGRLSPQAGPFGVAQDPGAPRIVNAATCTGADPAGCASAVEICGNNRDDDCNSLVDEQDPTCRTCQDDLLEENDDVHAPRVDPGRYENLSVCPGDEDWFGIYLRRNEVLSARVFFRHANGNLDLGLYGIDRQRVLVRSESLTDDEQLTHTATAAGQFVLRVFGDANTANDYTLELDVR